LRTIPSQGECDLGGVGRGVTDRPEPEAVEDTRHPEPGSGQDERCDRPGRDEPGVSDRAAPAVGQQQPEREERDRRLLREDREPEADARRGRLEAPRLALAEKQEESGQNGRHEELRGVRRHPESGGSDRQDRVEQRRGCGRDVPVEPPPEQEDEHDRGAVHDEQSEMNRVCRLAEHPEDRRVGDVGPGELHVVSGAVRRHAVQE